MPASDASSPNVNRRTKDGSNLLPDKNQIKKLSREDLEERYLQSCRENLQLKKRINEQEDQIGKQQRTRNLLATKLLKVSKGQNSPNSGIGDGDGPRVDLAEVHNYIFELEQQNMILRDKLKSAKYQLNAYTRFPLAPAPGMMSGRTSKGTAGPSSTTIHITSPTGKVDTFTTPTANTALLRQAEETIGKQRQQLTMYEAEIAALKQQIHLKRVAFDDEISRLQTQITSDQRMTTNENIEIIRMQKIVREQANEISVLQVRCNKHEMDLRSCKSQHQSTLMEMDQVKAKIHVEQTVNAQLQTELRTLRSVHDGTLLKLNQEVETLKKENEILKDGNDRVLASAFNVEREKQWEVTERTLRHQLTTLEAAVKADAGTMNELLEKLANEIAGKEETEQQLRKLEVQNVQLKAEAENAQQRLNKLTTAQGVDYVEIEEAIVYLKQKKGSGEPIDLHIPHFVTQLPPEEQAERDTKQQLANLQLTFTETVQELEKTRNMLLIEYKINQEFKAETEEVSRKSERLKEDYERKLKEYAELVDERALIIQKLERRVYDLAYGSGASQPSTKQEIGSVTLEPGRNLLELHLSELKLSDDALRLMQSPEPTIFVTIEFYDFEIQFTPMLTGSSVPMDFTCQYEVMVNDLFLHYMQTECAHIELHQAIGSHYKTRAAGKIPLKDIIDRQEGKSLGNAELLGINEDALLVSFGHLRFSLQLHTPMERALRLYKDRVKSLGYLVDDKNGQRKTNQLRVQIHRCRDLRNKANCQPPSVYAAYRLFEFPDHDTKVAPAGLNAELSDQAWWPLTMDKTVDEYLRHGALRVYVLDDSAEDDAAAYIGHADIPLLPLARDKTITGTFPLNGTEGEACGSIDVSLNWQLAYAPPPDSITAAEPMIPLPAPTRVTIPPAAPVEDKIIAAVRKAQPPILPEPATADGEGEVEMEQTAVIIDREIRGNQEATLTRSATFDKLTDEEREQPQKVPRKTWEKKTPVAPPRRQKKESVGDKADRGPSHETEANSSTCTESDSDVVVGVEKPQDVVFSIHSLRLPEHSPLLKDNTVKRVFLEWKMLDLPPDECETPNSYEKPADFRQILDINFQQVVPMDSSRAGLLKGVLARNESLVLALISDPGDEGECMELGAAALDFRRMVETERDLEHTSVNVLAPDGRILAILEVSLIAVQAIRRSALV